MSEILKTSGTSLKVQVSRVYQNRVYHLYCTCTGSYWLVHINGELLHEGDITESKWKGNDSNIFFACNVHSTLPPQAVSVDQIEEGQLISNLPDDAFFVFQKSLKYI